jgi:hypothetical protein
LKENIHKRSLFFLGESRDKSNPDSFYPSKILIPMNANGVNKMALSIIILMFDANEISQ